MKKFNGNCTKNARIKIDYSGKKPNVTFSYPSKKHGHEGNMFPFICLVWFIIFAILFSINQTIETAYDIGKTNSNNSTNGILYFNGTVYNVSTYNGCVDYMVDKTKQSCSIITSSNYISISTNQKIRDELKVQYTSLFFILLGLLGPPCLIYFPFKKKWQNIYPVWQAKGKKKYSVFKVEDIKYTKEYGYYCELSVFSNIVLNYDAKKEFGKYLNFIEIEEHKFKYWEDKPKKKMTKKQKENRIKRMLNDWIWYARFYFKKKPTTGQLEVLYR